VWDTGSGVRAECRGLSAATAGCPRGTKEVLGQPLPETTAALDALAADTDDTDEALVEEFDRAAATTGRIAPECVGSP
jgi:hypothetical protein